MSLSKIIDASDSVAIVGDGDVLAVSGYNGYGVPEQLLLAIEERFIGGKGPRGLTLLNAAAQGDGDRRGLNHLGHEGLLGRVIAGHFGVVPRVAQLVLDDKIEGYNFPEGVILHLYRAVAAGAPGLLSKVGMGTFVDPRIEGGKINQAAVEDLIDVVDLGGEEWLFYRALPIDIALVRGTTADPEGNVTMEREPLSLEALSLAIAAKTSGGYVICQVERVAEAGSLDSREVVIPGVMVDAVVVAEPEHHRQTYRTGYDPAIAGEIRVPLRRRDGPPLDFRTVAARRAARELDSDDVIVLGLGLPELLVDVAAAERISDLLTFTVDSGVIGGEPLGGFEYGAAINRQAVVDHAAAFDFIDGGGLDAVFLGVGECDGNGDVNVSRFGGRLAGCGGFINLTQRTRKVVFMTPFSSGGLEAVVEDGSLSIVEEGRVPKFVDRVEQITFSGVRAWEEQREIIYVTERCVFTLGPRGLVLAEVAPGVDVERQVLALLPFRPEVEGPASMDPAIFRPETMGLRTRLLDVRVEDRLTYNEASNTVFMDFAGMHVRTPHDVERVVAAVDAVLAPLDRRVNSIVNYDRFVLDDDVVQTWADAVRYVQDRYYLSVSRYTSSGFLRLKLGKELSKRRISPVLFDSEQEAQQHLES